MTKKSVLALAVLSTVSVAAMAQTNSAPQVPSIDGVPTSPDAMWTYAISAVTPMLVLGIRKLVPKVPGWVLPTATPFIGVILGLGLNALAGANLTWVSMAKAGALAVAIREIVNQAVTKQLTSPEAPEAPAPVVPPADPKA